MTMQVDEVLSEETNSLKDQRQDVIKSTVGDFGRWQLKISVLMALVKFPIAWFQMSIVFLAPPITFWCKKSTNWSDDSQLGSCLVNNSKCDQFTYDNSSMFTTTIITEWDLVCDKEKLVDVSQVSLMFGVLLGNIIFGILADKKGRKTILILCLLMQSMFGVLAAFSPFFWLFCALRFMLALANGGTMVTSFVICMEVVGGKWRTIVPILYQIPFGFGYSLLSFFAYFIREWRCLHLTLSVLSMTYLALYWFIPESPRWLLAVGKHQEALIILENATRDTKTECDINLIMTNLSNTASTSSGKRSLKMLFSREELRSRSLLLSATWFIAGVTFYAFIQHVGHIGHNLFLTVAVGGFVSLPGTLLCVLIINKFSRRQTICSSCLVTALSSLLILGFPKGEYHLDWPRLLLSGAGIIGLSISIPAMYLFTGELYPTIFRNSGVGLAMMFSRLGSMVAPLLISLQTAYEILPLTVIGVLAFLQAVLVLVLPEMHGTEDF
ncbi:organic cation transporter-like protein [Anthonomus grandis grandis]|uniref:organic cation transporter-like protein n=1 Tax=Anthonomus grandis grandis TaxID=2921223 RepID=UPI002165B481|nr:organic cation transporter-like protein [Anthonomus grandis grandis]